MIDVFQHHDDSTGTPGYWIAVCEIDGVLHRARSRNGAPQELARLLVDLGVRDQSMRVYSAGLAGYATYRSLHKAATRKIEEGERRGPKSARWIDPASRIEGLRKRRP